MRSALKKTIAIMIVISLATTAFGFLFAYVEYARSESGFQSIDTSKAAERASVLAASCVVGILSKFIFDRISRRYKTNFSLTGAIVNSAKAVVVAMIVSPIIIVGLYGLIEKVEDPILLFLIAYQNGFFFQTVLGKAEPSQGALI